MAAATGISLRSVQRIWAAHGLQPHRVRRFKLSQDPAFAVKLRDVVGLLSRSVGAQPGAVGRREVANPGTRSNPAGPADQKGAGRDDDPRLYPARHDDAVCRAQCPRQLGHRPVHGTPSPPGIHPFSEPHRGCGAGRQAHSRDPRQLRRPQASQGAYLARPAPRWTFHFTPTSCSWANAVEGFFATPHPPALAARGLPLAGRFAGRDQPLSRRAQPQPKPFVWTADPDRIIEKINRG